MQVLLVIDTCCLLNIKVLDDIVKKNDSMPLMQMWPLDLVIGNKSQATSTWV